VGAGASVRVGRGRRRGLGRWRCRASAVALAHNAKERCANVVEGVEQLGVDVVNVAERQSNVDASACLAR
jgi:hypothetical protein